MDKTAHSDLDERKHTMADPVLEQVRNIISDLFDVPLEEVNAESSQNTIERWDSLQHLNLVLAIEQTFGIQLAPEEIERMLNVESIVMLVGKKLSQGNLLKS